MRIGQAIYGLPSIKRLGETPRSGRGASELSPVSSPNTAPSEYASTETAEMTPKLPALKTLGDMLHHHFVEEVRQRDRDGDGKLTRREYGGNSEEFALLDRDRDGLIAAGDLARVALDRNPTLKELVSGDYSPIYNALLQQRDPSDDALADAVRQGAAKVAETRAKAADEAAKTARNWDRDPAPTGAESILLDFLKQHPDLRSLHARLQDLADRLGRNHEYAAIDRLA